MRIGIDMDDTLVDFVGGLIKFHNKRYRTSLEKDDFCSYRFSEVWGGNMNEAVKRVDKFFDCEKFSKLEPLRDSVEVVRKLAVDNELFVVTSRPIKFENNTNKILREGYHEFFKDVFYSANHYTGNTGLTKKEICDKYKINLLIEDSVDYANQCATPKMKVLLLEQPWNKNKGIGLNISRVKNWRRVIDYMEAN